MKAHRLANLAEGINLDEASVLDKLKKVGIKTMADLDAYIKKHPLPNGDLESRYHTLKKLVGEKAADKIMHELMVQSWKMGKKGMGEETENVQEIAPAQVEATDPDGEMALTQLKNTAAKASALLKMIQPNSKLEPWVQSKITLADDYITTIHDYLTHTPGAIGEAFEDFEEGTRK